MGFWELNLQVLAILSEHRTALFDFFFSAVTWLGSEYVVVGVLAVFYLLIDKKTAYKLGCSFIFSSVAVQLIKIVCRIPRPWVLIGEHPIHRPYKPLDKLGSLAKATGYSFPSGHTQSAFSLFGFLGVRCRKTLPRVGFFLLAAVVAFSRLYLGVHTPFDVIVAAGVALVVLFAVEALFDRLYDTKWHFVLPLAVGVLALISLIVTLDFYDVGIFAGEEKMCYDTLKVNSLGLSLPIAYFVERYTLKFDPREGSVLRKTVRVIAAVGGVLGLKELVKAIGKLLYGGETLGVVFLSHFLMIPFAMLLVPACERFIVRKIAARRKINQTGEA